MKNRGKFIKFFCFSICLFFSCGLDTFYVLSEPNAVFRPEVYDEVFNIDFTKRYFDFQTNEEDFNEEENSGFRFMGTSVYYKIYNNFNTMISERSYLENLAYDDETSSKAPTQLIESYKYCLLNNKEPLVSYNGMNKNVLIRLTDYQVENYDQALQTGEEDNAARIMIAGEYLGKAPVRVDGKSTFNFGRDGENDNVPQDGDNDVKYSSTTTEEGFWYVTMFAVAVGMDTTFTKTYSNIEYLGTVAIDANSYDN